MRVEDLDFEEVVSRSPDGGALALLGERALLVDAVALGWLRRRLIEALGMERARQLLGQVGYAQGWRVAERLREGYPALLREPDVGGRMHALTGQLIVAEVGFHAGVVQGTWADSCEAEQQLLHLGPSRDGACWMAEGFASGFCSCRTGTAFYFVEDRCRARGDLACHVVGRTATGWGEQAVALRERYGEEPLLAALRAVGSRLRARRRGAPRAAPGAEPATGSPGTVVAHSRAMRALLARARRVARTDSSVVIEGESGAGKEVIAQLIHAESRRAAGPFVPVNCGALVETLLERELFGHARGAFTGAEREAVGLFEAAGGGTIFLDEIGEVSPRMQVKLLRVLEAREVLRVGESKPRPIDVRILAATNRDLEAEVAAGRFRRDLYYRLNVIGLRIPPLRERPEDVLPLARTFLHALSAAHPEREVEFDPQVQEQLLRYPWPGNVRELRNAVEHALAMCPGGRIEVEHLPRPLRARRRSAAGQAIRPLRDVEADHILAALRAARGNRAAAARALGIGLATLYRRLKELREGQPATADHPSGA